MFDEMDLTKVLNEGVPSQPLPDYVLGLLLVLPTLSGMGLALIVSSVWPSRHLRGRRAAAAGNGFFDNMSFMGMRCRWRLRGLKRFDVDRKKFEESLEQRWQEDKADKRAIEVQVASVSGQQWYLQITSRTTGADVRARLAKMCDFPRQEVAIIFGTDPVEDHEVLLTAHPTLRTVSDPVLTMFRMQRHFALSASSDKHLRMWDLDSKSAYGVMSGHLLRVNCVCVDWVSRRALSGSSDGTLRLWNLDTQQCVESFGDDRSDIKCMSVNWDLQKVLAGDIAAVRLWDLGTATCLGTLRGDVYVVQCLAVDWVRQRALSGSCDGAVGFWDLESFGGVTSMYGHMTWVTCVSLDPNSCQGLTAAIDGTIRLWDVDGGICFRTIHGTEWGDTRCIEVCWATMCAVSGAAGGVLKLWDLNEGNLFKTVDSGLEAGMLNDINSIAANWSTNQVITGAVNGEIRLWSLEELHHPVEVLSGHTHEVGCLALSGCTPDAPAVVLRRMADECRQRRRAEEEAEAEREREDVCDAEESEEDEEEEEEEELENEGAIDSEEDVEDLEETPLLVNSQLRKREGTATHMWVTTGREEKGDKEEASSSPVVDGEICGAGESTSSLTLRGNAAPSPGSTHASESSSSSPPSNAWGDVDCRSRHSSNNGGAPRAAAGDCPTSAPRPRTARAFGDCLQGPMLCLQGFQHCWRSSSSARGTRRHTPP